MCDDAGDFAQIHCPACELGKRGHAFVSDAAWHDHPKVLQVGVDVEREAVTGNPARDSDADGGDLFVTDPHAGQPGDALAFDTVFANRANQDFFDVAHVTVHVAAIRLEIDHRIADQLARPVISHVAAASGLVNFD